MKLGGWVRCTKISEFKCQGQRSKSPAAKTAKCGILFGSRPLGRGPRPAFFSAAVLGGASTTVGESAHAV